MCGTLWLNVLRQLVGCSSGACCRLAAGCKQAYYDSSVHQGQAGLRCLVGGKS